VIGFDHVDVMTDEGVQLLHDITLTVSERRVGVIGANGSGKTTFARLVNGLTLPTTGSVRVGELDTARDPRAVQRAVGFVFQDADHQLVYPTPREDIALGLRAHGLSKADANEAAMSTLRRVALAHKADQAIHTLSGGEKHLVALCGVLALEPTWIVLDEPTTTLDLVNRRRVVEVLLGLPQHLIIVSHDLDLVRQLDRVVLLDRGEVVGDGRPGPVIDAYTTLVGGT
jgi:biotin transport system ATP-binding protein